MQEQQKRVLVVNADDLGYSARRDAGILQAFKCGVVTSVSLLVNGATSREAAREAVSLGVPLGLHLNLTEGQCLSEAPNGLCAEDTKYMRVKMGFREAAAQGKITEDEIAREIDLQLAKFK